MVLLVLKKPDIASSSFLPLLAIAIKFEQFGPHLENLFFRLFVGLCLDFLGQMDNRLEVNFRRLGRLFL